MSFSAELESLVAAQIEVVKTAASIFKLETRLAGLSVYPLLVTLCLLLVALMSTWICAAVALGYALVQLIPYPLVCVVILLLLHVAMVYSLLQYTLYNLKNMSFEKTRHYIGNHHVQSKKASYSKHYAHGTKVALPAKRRKGT